MEFTHMNRKERLALAVEAEVDPGVVDRLLAGKSIRAASRRVLLDAARRLNITLPASPSAPPSTPEGAVAA